MLNLGWKYPQIQHKPSDDDLDSIENITIFRALQLGDLLCVVPALRALRRRFPQAQITLIGLPWAKKFVERFQQYLNDFIEFPGYPGFPEQMPQLERIPSFIRDVQMRRFDLALQMQGSGLISNSLCALFGARDTAGFYIPGQYRPHEDWFIEYPVHEPEILRHMRLIEHLGATETDYSLEFPILDVDREQFQGIALEYSIQREGYVCLHPGSRAINRRWPAHRFATVADYFGKLGYQVILTGTQDERQITQLVSERANFPVIDLAGETDLGSLAVLLQGARALISNDTGVSHLADALKVPSVILYTASDPNRWAPLDQNLHRIIRWASAATPQIVIDEIEALMRMERTYAV